MAVNYSGLSYECGEVNHTYSLLLKIGCNKNIIREMAHPKMIASDPCNYEIYLEVDQGCPKVDLSVFRDFVNKYKALFALGFIIFGIIIGLFGRPMWPTIIFLLIACSVALFFLVTLGVY